MGKSSKVVVAHDGGKGKAVQASSDDNIPIGVVLTEERARKAGIEVLETKNRKLDWGGPPMDSDQWWEIVSKVMGVDAEGGEMLRRARGILAWKTPKELEYQSAVDPKIILEKSIYSKPAELAKLNSSFFAPKKPMRVLGHVAKHIPGKAEGWGSDRYSFKHEGGFLFNEYCLTNVGIRFPFSDFEMEVLNYINCCPAQLHPNSWRLLAILQNVAAHLNIVLTAKVLFWAYKVDCKGSGWVSLRSLANRIGIAYCLLT